MTNARSIIAEQIRALVRENGAPTCCAECADGWMIDYGEAIVAVYTNHTSSALMAAADVEPGGDLIIHHGDGWGLGRLTPHGSWLTKRNADGTLHCNHDGREFCTAPDHTTETPYRVVAP